MEPRFLVAEELQAAWMQGSRPADACAGAVLEAHCWGLRSEALSDWEASLTENADAQRMMRYGRHACRMLAALCTARDPALSPATVFEFLNELETHPLQGRPHADFLEKEAQEQARVAQATADSKKDRSGAGFLQCRKCQSRDVDTDAKQLRSADEPMTVFASCNGCGSRWTMS